MSKNNTGQFKKGVSSWNKGISPSFETRQKMREAKLKNPSPNGFQKGHLGFRKGHILERLDGYRYIAYSLIEKEIQQYLIKWKTRPIPEHCYIWCKENKREIPKGFHIHHMNHIKNDNRIENLLLIKAGDHTKEHQPWKYNK